jgi:hypothetical protein
MKTSHNGLTGEVLSLFRAVEALHCETEEYCHLDAGFVL